MCALHAETHGALDGASHLGGHGPFLGDQAGDPPNLQLGYVYYAKDLHHPSTFHEHGTTRRVQGVRPAPCGAL